MLQQVRHQKFIQINRPVYEQSTIAAVEQKTKNKIPGARFRIDTEADVPGIIILIFVFQENPKLPIRSVSREDADYVFFLSPFSPAALQTYGSREV